MIIPHWLRRSSDEFVLPFPRRTVALNAEQLREDEERMERRDAYCRAYSSEQMREWQNAVAISGFDPNSLRFLGGAEFNQPSALWPHNLYAQLGPYGRRQCGLK